MGVYAKEHTFWCTTNWFAELSARCPGNNVYFSQAWTPTIVDSAVQYPTAEEAAYPELLCQRLAEYSHGLIGHGRSGCGISTTATAGRRCFSSSDHSGCVAPREKFKPLVSEYGAYITVMHAAAVEETALEVPTTAKLVHQRFPNGVSVGLMM